MQTLKVSEIFSSIQGEGPSAGKPCTFLRLALCNLHCHWCDTKYTWDFEHYSFREEVHHRNAEEIARALTPAAGDRVVITGGEPLLQQAGLEALFSAMGGRWYVEVETNGTLVPSRSLVERVNQWNVSPKLSSAGDPSSKRIRLDALQALRDTGQAWLKLVIDDENDLTQADELITRLGWPKDRVFFMPQAATRVELQRRSKKLELACRKRGLRLSPRLHIERWDGARGR
ncbi:MAG TPA: 7-carboxy-7-deazaguanine synthase QueE [Polyangiaceae bacterium]